MNIMKGSLTLGSVVIQMTRRTQILCRNVGAGKGLYTFAYTNWACERWHQTPALPPWLALQGAEGKAGSRVRAEATQLVFPVREPKDAE